MPTREQLHKEVDSVPEDQLDNAQVLVLEPNGNSAGAGDNDDDDDQPVDEARIHALQEVFETFASMDFLPREDAWH